MMREVVWHWVEDSLPDTSVGKHLLFVTNHNTKKEEMMIADFDLREVPDVWSTPYWIEIHAWADLPWPPVGGWKLNSDRKRG